MLDYKIKFKLSFLYRIYSDLKNIVYLYVLAYKLNLMLARTSGIQLIGKEFRPIPKVGLIATDMDKNLLVTCYKPDMKESAGGKQLVRQCDFNLGKWLKRAQVE